VLREPEFLKDRELSLIYVAKKLKEALALEQLLTEAGLDYLVEPGPIQRRNHLPLRARRSIFLRRAGTRGPRLARPCAGAAIGARMKLPPKGNPLRRIGVSRPSRLQPLRYCCGGKPIGIVTILLVFRLGDGHMGLQIGPYRFELSSSSDLIEADPGPPS